MQAFVGFPISFDSSINAGGWFMALKNYTKKKRSRFSDLLTLTCSSASKQVTLEQSSAYAAKSRVLDSALLVSFYFSIALILGGLPHLEITLYIELRKELAHALFCLSQG